MVLDQLPGIKELYLWSYFRDIDELRWRRQQAYLRFVDDFKRYGWQRYVPTEYPRTTFTNGQFALALVSHFLFLYDRQLTYEFHKHTVAELLRITSQEIRIFPLIGLNGRRSPFLERLLHDPMLARCYSKIQSVDYEFMRGGNEMLVISKRPLPR
jgi:hypothetical protein